MADLERCLQESQEQRFRVIVTDGVFSMDGNVAPVDKICDLAEKYNALVMVDESHSAGVVGATGHGVSELCKTYDRVDIYTGTLGKAFGGAICAVMLYDAKLSQVYAAKLLEEGIYVTGFYYPVVPKGEARIRVQLSAGHNREQLDKCINAFIKIGKELGVLK